MQAISKDLYPFQSQQLQLDSLNYHYLDEGKGEPIVMVHGNPTWSFYYRRLAEALMGQYRVIVPDHIGCGFSSKPDDSEYEYTLERRVNDLESLLDHLDVKEGITLVVHDWGGMIGMAYAARHPKRIKRIIALNTAAFHMPGAKSFPFALWLLRNTPIGPFLVRGLNIFCRAATWVGCKRSEFPTEVKKAYLAPYDSWKDRIAILRFVQDIPLSKGDRAYPIVDQVEAALPNFSETPMLLFWGEKDFVFDCTFLEEWKRRFPHAEAHSFPDGGHYILEDAFDEILPLIQKFLASSGKS